MAEPGFKAEVNALTIISYYLKWHLKESKITNVGDDVENLEHCALLLGM